MNIGSKALALLSVLILVSCSANSSSSQDEIYTPSVPVGDLSSEAFFEYGNFLNYYTNDVTSVTTVKNETLVSLNMTSHSQRSLVSYNSDIMESLGTSDLTYVGYPTIHLDVKEQTYIRDGYIRFIHDEGSSTGNYRISHDYTPENYGTCYYIGPDRTNFKYFSSAGTHYSSSVLLRSGVTTDDGVILYVCYSMQETDKAYGYMLNMQVEISGGYIIYTYVDEDYYQDKKLIYSYSSASTFGHDPKGEYPWTVDLLDWTQYPEKTS